MRETSSKESKEDDNRGKVGETKPRRRKTDGGRGKTARGNVQDSGVDPIVTQIEPQSSCLRRTLESAFRQFCSARQDLASVLSHLRIAPATAEKRGK